MEEDLANIIKQIQEIKNAEYHKHKHEIIDGRQALNCMEPTTDTETTKSWEYECLMRQQRRMLYRKDISTQQKAAAKLSELRENEMTKKLELANQNAQNDDSTRTLAVKITLKPCDFDPLNDNQDLQKPWHKLSSSQKIQAAIQFIEAISSYLTEDQVIKLRYLLISAVSQRKITRKTDVDYNIDEGYINQIYKLKYENDTFILSEKDDKKNGVALSTFIDESAGSADSPQNPKISIKSLNTNTDTGRKKIVLLKKK